LKKVQPQFNEVKARSKEMRAFFKSGLSFVELTAAWREKAAEWAERVAELKENVLERDGQILALEENIAVLEGRASELEGRCGETVSLRVSAFFLYSCFFFCNDLRPRTHQFVGAFDFSHALSLGLAQQCALLARSRECRRSGSSHQTAPLTTTFRGASHSVAIHCSPSCIMFTLQMGQWTQKQKLTSPDAFGESITLSCNTIIMGEYGNNNERGQNLGSALHRYPPTSGRMGTDPQDCSHGWVEGKLFWKDGFNFYPHRCSGCFGCI